MPWRNGSVLRHCFCPAKHDFVHQSASNWVSDGERKKNTREREKYREKRMEWEETNEEPPEGEGVTVSHYGHQPAIIPLTYLWHCFSSLQNTFQGQKKILTLPGLKVWRWEDFRSLSVIKSSGQVCLWDFWHTGR